MDNFDQAKIDGYIKDGNHLAAYQYIKDATIPRELLTEYTGKIVNAIIEELGRGTGSRDRTLYFRSLLVYIFEDIPGLARIYQRQLRLVEESRNSFDLLKNIRSLVDASRDKDELKAKLDDVIGGIKEKIDDTTEDIKDGTAQQNIENFFHIAGEGIKEGIRQFSSFVRNISESGERRDDNTPEKKEPGPEEDRENKDGPAS